jgi:hypothetical protein
MFNVESVTFGTLPPITLDRVGITGVRRYAWARVTRDGRTEDVSFNPDTPLSLIQTVARFFDYITTPVGL